MKIFNILESAIRRERATASAETIKEVTDTKSQNEATSPAAKEDLQKGQQKAFNKIETHLRIMFIILVVLILGLYATVIFIY